MILKGAKQKILGTALETIFPDKHITTNVRKQGQLVAPNAGSYWEIDYYVRDLKLCFEYQDAHHYATTWYTQSPTALFQANDENKRVKVVERGETLITIPCWWDETVGSLIATIRSYRPDLFVGMFSEAFPISLRPPHGYFKTPDITGIGEVMLPSVPVGVYDPKDWWLSEKYDGVRAAWNTSDKRAYSRYGRPFQIPKHFFGLLPFGIILDGEIWFGRGNFDEAQKVATDEGATYEFMRFACFDFFLSLPLSFEARQQLHASLFLPHHPTVICATHVKCVDNAHVVRFSNYLWKDCGEGSVIRAPNSVYQHGRADCALKLKVCRDDEAIVDGIEEGHVTLRLPNQQTFRAGLDPRFMGIPKTGDIVEFEYDTKLPNTGIPVNPRIVRMRGDLIWEDVVSNFHSSNDRAESGETKKPQGYWVNEDLANVREFFNQFALDSGRDPLLPSSWYDVSTTDFFAKGGEYILRHYGGSLIKALADIYPNIGLEERNFQIMPRHYWRENENKQKFFELFAKKRNFDPLCADNWYNISNQDVKDEKSGVSVLNTYSGSLSKALTSVFPKMKIELQKFHNTRFRYWQSIENQRDFFVRFAKRRGFNPLVSENWRSIGTPAIMSIKGGASVLRMYGMSLAKALKAAFPQIHFQQSRR